MINDKIRKHTAVTDKERREFLKVIGVAGAVGASGVTLGELNDTVEPTGIEGLSALGATVSEEMAGAVNADLLATQQAELASALAAAPAAVESGAAFEESGKAFDEIDQDAIDARTERRVGDMPEQKIAHDGGRAPTSYWPTTNRRGPRAQRINRATPFSDV